MPPILNNLYDVIGIGVVAITFTTGVLTLASIYLKSKKQSAPDDDVVNLILDRIKDKGYQTNANVNKTITDRENQFLVRVCKQHWKESDKVDNELKTTLKELTRTQVSQGKLLARMDTTIVLLARKQQVEPPPLERNEETP